MMKTLPSILALGASLLLAPNLVGQGEMGEKYGPQPAGAPEAKIRYEAALKAHKGNADMLVLPGLVADRKEHTVEILVEATGLAGQSVAEFLLVDQNSSHGYEALLWSFAKPSDVHAALVFIGLSPGAPYDPRALRFFADGDPVDLFIKEADSDEVRIEELIIDRESGESLPHDGFVFAGSIIEPLTEGQPEDTPRYAADIYDPRSVASVYNEPTAVLDVPRKVQKGEAYGNQVVNPETAFNRGELLTVVMRPREHDGDAPLKRELVLRVGGGGAAAGKTNAAVTAALQLGIRAGDDLYQGSVSDEMLKALMTNLKSMAEGQVAYMELDVEESTPLQEAQKVASIMAVLESMGVLMVNPPPDGQLYYRGFIPDRRWLDPAGRPAQPWELHLKRHEGGMTGEMVMNQAVWNDVDSTRSFTRTVVPVATPGAVRQQLDADSAARAEAGDAAAPAALLAYATKDMTVGDVMTFLRPVLSTHGAVYVFLEE